MLKAIATKVDITPADEETVVLRGYPGGVLSYSSSDKPPGGLPVRPDRLFARILLLEQERPGVPTETVALVGLDCWAANEQPVTVKDIHGVDSLTWDPAIHPGTRAGWAKAAGVVVRNLSIYPTHTHCAPALTPAMAQKVNDEILRLRARPDWKRVRVFGGVVSSAVCRNRLAPLPPDSPVDRSLIVMDFRGEDNESVAHLVNFGVHPTFLGDNRTTSAELVGVAMSILEKRKPGLVSLFLQGWSGDLGPNDRCLDPLPPPPPEDRTYRQMERMAQVLAADAVRALGQAKELGGDRLKVVELEPKKLPVKPGHPPLSGTVTILGVAIGNTVLVGVSGEMYQDYGPILTEYAPRTFMPSCGMVNGYSGYILTARGFGIPSYEANTTPFTPEAPSHMRAAFKELFEKLG